MQEFTLKNLSNQGLRVEVVRGGVVSGFLVGSGSTVTIEADSIHPNTQSLIDGGYITLSGDREAAAVRDQMSIPLSYAGAWEASSYKKGSVVRHSGVIWVSLSDQNISTPALQSDWVIFSNEDSNSVHILDKDNPHDTSAEQVGAIPVSSIGLPHGVAQLDQDGKIHPTLLPSLANEPAVFQAWALRHKRNGDDALASDTPNFITASQIKNHVTSQNNPHNTTLQQLGGIPLSLMAQPLGVATLAANGRLPIQQLPLSFSVSAVYVVSNIGQRDQLAPSLTVGSVVRTTVNRKTWLWSGSSFIDWTLPESWVHTINGATGQAINLTTRDIPEHSSKPYYSDGRVEKAPVVIQLIQRSHDRNRDSHLDISGPNRVSAHDIKSHLLNHENPHRVTARQIGAVPIDPDIKDVSGEYTVQKMDSGVLIRTSGNSILLPASGFPDRFQCTIIRTGDNNVVVSSPGGNLQSKGNTLAEKYDACTCYYLGGGVWEAVGAFAFSGSQPVDLNFSPAVTAFLQSASLPEMKTALEVGNVNDTADADKQVSTAQAAADSAVAQAAADALSIGLDQAASDLASGLSQKQPLSQNLSAEAGLVGAADKLSYFTGLGAKALTTLTAFSRTLLACADAAAFLTAIGFSRQKRDFTTQSYTSTLSLDASLLGLYSDRHMVLTGDTTIGVPSNPTDGQVIKLWFLASGASRSIALASTIKIPTGTTFTGAVASGSRRLIELSYNGGWVVTSNLEFQS